MFWEAKAHGKKQYGLCQLEHGNQDTTILILLTLLAVVIVQLIKMQTQILIHYLKA